MKKVILILAVLGSFNVSAKELRYEAPFNLQPPYEGKFILSVTMNGPETTFQKVLYKATVTDDVVEANANEETPETHRYFCNKTWIAPLGNATVQISKDGKNVIAPALVPIQAVFTTQSEAADAVTNCSDNTFLLEPVRADYVFKFNPKSVVEGNFPEFIKIDLQYSLSSTKENAEFVFNPESKELKAAQLPVLPETINVGWWVSKYDTNSSYMPNSNMTFDQIAFGTGVLNLKK